MRLTEKQETFCLEYLKDLNATQAAIRAGYSAKSANRIASAMLSKHDITERLSQLMSERNERVKVDADYVLNRLLEIDSLDVVDILDDRGELKSLAQWPEAWRRSISGLDVTELGDGNGAVGMLKRVKWPDKVKNLELLGKHIDVQAFKERQETELKNLPPVLNISLTK
jgi:phage terminase small subunit